MVKPERASQSFKHQLWDMDEECHIEGKMELKAAIVGCCDVRNSYCNSEVPFAVEHEDTCILPPNSSSWVSPRTWGLHERNVEGLHRRCGNPSSVGPRSS